MKDEVKYQLWIDSWGMGEHVFLLIVTNNGKTISYLNSDGDIWEASMPEIVSGWEIIDI